MLDFSFDGKIFGNFDTDVVFICYAVDQQEQYLTIGQNNRNGNRFAFATVLPD